MNARIVVGSCYGDEGKGTIVARLSKNTTNLLNVLTNGGAQRAHSILTKDGGFTFQHFGSGTYYGADNYFSRFYILNPMQFAKEYETLFTKPKNIYVDFWCRFTTPYDMMANNIMEEALKRKASCRMGIWNTVKRYKETDAPTFWEFMASANKEQHLAFVKAYYEKFLDIPDSWKPVWNNPTMVSHYISDCAFMVEKTKFASFDTMGATYNDFVFENGQGLLLCDKGVDTSDTTPSHTGSLYAKLLVNDLGVETNTTIHYVTRPYLTRHGDGDMENGCNQSLFGNKKYEDRTNTYNDAQGNFRIGELDMAKLKERISLDAEYIPFVLEVTHCDEMDREVEFKKNFENVNFYETPIV